MFRNHSTTRDSRSLSCRWTPAARGRLAPILALVLLATPAAARAATHSITLAAGGDSTVTASQSGEQWDDDIINLAVTDSGVLLVEVTEGSVTNGDGTETFCTTGSRSLGTGWLPSGTTLRSVAVRPGDYSFTVSADEPSGSQAHRIKMRLVASCPSPAGSAVAQSLLCAPDLCFGGTVQRSLDAGGDRHAFTFVVEGTTSQQVALESSGLVDLVGDLYDGDGGLVTSDDDSGSGANFYMAPTLSPGRYLLEVRSNNNETGTYDVSLD